MEGEMSQLITESNAAILLCVSPATLRKWRWEGKGPKFIKVGRKVAYRDSDIAAFIDSQVRQSTSDPGFCTP